MSNQETVAGAVKKAFQPVVDFLNVNQDKTVGEILPDIITMCAGKGARMGTTSIKDAMGTVLAIFCWYHKQWELVVGDNAVDYSTKPNTSTGLNSMCKIGNNLWSKANNEKKKVEKANYEAFISGNLTQEEAKAQRDAEAAQPTGPDMEGAPVGYATKEEVIEALTQLGYSPVTSA